MDAIYDKIGAGYNVTRQADAYITGRLRHFLNPWGCKLYLDIGCGTGNYTVALANTGVDFVGVEPSVTMLEKARNNGQKVKWLQGSAENIPAEDNVFDGVMATLTIHHWKDLNQSFSEIYRVTKEKGVFVLFTALPSQMGGYWLNHYFPQMMNSSIVQMPSLELIKSALSHSGFEVINSEKYFIQQDLQDCFLFSGKHNPSLYFNTEIRRGISSFSALANADEVNTGLLKLDEDIKSGEFARVKEKYDNDFGDYLFIVAGKK